MKLSTLASPKLLTITAVALTATVLTTAAIVRADTPQAPYSAPVVAAPTQSTATAPAAPPTPTPTDPVPATTTTATATTTPAVGGSAPTAPTVSDSGAVTVVPTPLDHHTVMPSSTVQTRATNRAGQTVYSCTYAWSDGSTETSELAVTAGDGSSAFIPADCPEWTL